MSAVIRLTCPRRLIKRFALALGLQSLIKEYTQIVGSPMRPSQGEKGASSMLVDQWVLKCFYVRSALIRNGKPRVQIYWPFFGHDFITAAISSLLMACELNMSMLAPSTKMNLVPDGIVVLTSM